MYNKILVPTDGSPGAAGATQFALELVSKEMAKSITLLHVVYPGSEDSNLSLASTQKINEELFRNNLAHHGRYLLQESQNLIKEKGLEINIIVELGEASGERIVKVAKEKGFDLIVMGSRGFSPLKELILGSVSTFVLRNAHCPVVIYNKSM
jgi:nucleotide-binding universal stress UspA family protein